MTTRERKTKTWTIGRVCRMCDTKLSRYNPERLCASCEKERMERESMFSPEFYERQEDLRQRYGSHSGTFSARRRRLLDEMTYRLAGFYAEESTGEVSDLYTKLIGTFPVRWQDLQQAIARLQKAGLLKNAGQKRGRGGKKIVIWEVNEDAAGYLDD